MENELEAIEDNDWEDRKSTRSERKQKAEKDWEETKKGWQELTDLEEFKNTVEGKWVQRGPYLINRNAKLEFASYIGMDYVLVGIDANGKPMLEKRH